jgi:hypothetical protein
LKKGRLGRNLNFSQGPSVNQKRIFEALKYAPLGGFSFWAPDVLLHWIRGYRFSGLDVLVLTVLLPITTALVVAMVWNRGLKKENRLLGALFALVGIWFFGPLMMSCGASFSGGGFSQPNGWHVMLMGTGLFPVFTFMMSTYDGTLGALLLTTALLPFLSTLCSLIDRRRLRGGAAVSNPPMNRL